MTESARIDAINQDFVRSARDAFNDQYECEFTMGEVLQAALYIAMVHEDEWAAHAWVNSSHYHP